jgi:hypothetical protein
MPKEVFKQSVDAPCIPEFNVRVTVVSSNVKLQPTSVARPLFTN